MSRPVRVWRLNVTLPEGSEKPGWQPEGWVADVSDWGVEGEYERPFIWPRRRNYLSVKGAKVMARILREYGATVQIEESEPVTWPS